MNCFFLFCVFYDVPSLECCSEYAKTVPRPFKVAYDEKSQRIIITEKSIA